jgi:hypothetical protein
MVTMIKKTGLSQESSSSSSRGSCLSCPVGYTETSKESQDGICLDYRLSDHNPKPNKEVSEQQQQQQQQPPVAAAAAGQNGIHIRPIKGRREYSLNNGAHDKEDRSFTGEQQQQQHPAPAAAGQNGIALFAPPPHRGEGRTSGIGRR